MSPNHCSKSTGQAAWTGACLVLASLLCAASPAHALSPDSPEVRATIDKGIKFLEGQPGGGMGLKALVGLTLAKNGASPDHPQIKDAVALIQASVKGGAENVRDDIYSTGVAIMFLVAVNPKQHRYDIETLVKSLHLRQKNEVDQGAWGYPLDTPNGKTCDTSMTQFAVLSLWEANDQAEVATPVDVWEKVAKWLLRTQDPNGGFGYQGKDSGEVGDRIKQADTLHSMTVAGLCSVYICRDRLGLSPLRLRTDDDTPSALKPIEDEDPAARVKTKIDAKWFNKSRGDGNHWMSDNFTIEKPKGWLYYYLYALERYETFRQMEAGGATNNAWYDRGARFLIDSQTKDGSWEGPAPKPADTCFALLFLLRSTKKTLERSAARYREGILVGGRGVPGAANVRLRDGRVVVKPAAVPVEEALPSPDGPALALDAQALETVEDLAAGADRETLIKHSETLRALAASPRAEVRRAAVRALSRARNLDDVPLLIARLEDDDVEVMLAARDGLKSISRRLDAFNFDVRGSAAARKEAIGKWKQWYRSIRPDAEF